MFKKHLVQIVTIFNKNKVFTLLSLDFVGDAFLEKVFDVSHEFTSVYIKQRLSNHQQSVSFGFNVFCNWHQFFIEDRELDHVDVNVI